MPGRTTPSFASSACRSRDPDHRQQRRGGLPVPTVVGDRSAVAQHEVDALRAVERAAAANADDRIDVQRTRECHSSIDHRAIRVDPDPVEEKRFDVLGSKSVEDAVGMPGLADARVGDDECAAEAKVPCDLSHARDGTRPEQHARSWLKIERHHLQ